MVGGGGLVALALLVLVVVVVVVVVMRFLAERQDIRLRRDQTTCFHRTHQSNGNNSSSFFLYSNRVLVSFYVAGVFKPREHGVRREAADREEVVGRYRQSGCAALPFRRYCVRWHVIVSSMVLPRAHVEELGTVNWRTIVSYLLRTAIADAHGSSRSQAPC